MFPFFSDLLSALAVSLELPFLTLACFAILTARGHSLAEAAAAALILPLMALSFAFQLGFLTGLNWISPLLESVFCLRAGMELWKNRAELAGAWRILCGFCEEHPSTAALCLVFCWMGADAGLNSLPGHPLFGAFPGEGDALRALDWNLFRDTGVGPRVPRNHLVLSHLFTRTGAVHGLFLPELAAYFSIGLSTYTLSRRYAWPPTALTLAFIVLSFPRFVHDALTPGGEIIPAASALLCLVSVYRLTEQPNIGDLAVLFWSIPFTVTAEAPGIVFPLILTGISVMMLFHRHGGVAWGAIVRRRPFLMGLCLIPSLIFSQILIFGTNQRLYGRWFPREGAFALIPNTDAMAGGIANLIRYGLESLHLMPPADFFFLKLMNVRMTALLNGLYDSLFLPLFSGAGAASPFHISWEAGTPAEWFGPLAALLAPPALVFAMIRGDRNLKAISTGLIGYLYIITLAVAWAPGNARFFTLFYACGGFCAAMILPPWRLTRAGKRMIHLVCMGLILYSWAVTSPGFMQTPASEPTAIRSEFRRPYPSPPTPP